MSGSIRPLRDGVHDRAPHGGMTRRLFCYLPARLVDCISLHVAPHAQKKKSNALTNVQCIPGPAEPPVRTSKAPNRVTMVRGFKEQHVTPFRFVVGIRYVKQYPLSGLVGDTRLCLVRVGASKREPCMHGAPTKPDDRAVVSLSSVSTGEKRRGQCSLPNTERRGTERDREKEPAVS